MLKGLWQRHYEVYKRFQKDRKDFEKDAMSGFSSTSIFDENLERNNEI